MEHSLGSVNRTKDPTRAKPDFRTAELSASSARLAVVWASRPNSLATSRLEKPNRRHRDSATEADVDIRSERSPPGLVVTAIVEAVFFVVSVA
jgi:hypothetical protein